MKNKILLSLFSLALVFGAVGFMGIQIAHAQFAPSFPVGCASNIGYSVTNGTPCNGASYATMNIQGCATALGYSITTGIPCDGASVAIQYFAGCTSLYGYSTVSSVPCNGTNVASIFNTPGFPITGAGGNAFVNIMLLLSSAVVAFLGSAYLVRKYRAAS